MSDPLEMMETMLQSQLAKEPLPSPDRIRELIGALRDASLFDTVSDEGAEDLALRFEERHGVSMKIGSMLIEDDFEPWLDSAKSGIDPFYWDRYRKYLGSSGFSGQVLATTDEVTDRILGLAQNPMKPAPWDRRGMVLGHVQSGKTANYTGLICKAADAGYKLIIVIAGIHNNLRNQTQMRIDQGLVGRDSGRLLSNKGGGTEKFIGVGKIDSSRKPVTFTNSLRDFNKAMATGVGVSLDNLKDPAVFVIKKNTSTLKNLIEWLTEHNSRSGVASIDAPMLLVDDEADNASINISSKKDEISRINGQLRDLLNLFQRSCYVGYTATPFANIFIDPNTDNEMRGADLFPRDFIVSLDPPTNYFGASRVFLDESSGVIEHIFDNEDLLPIKHKKDHEIVALPETLRDSIRTFVLGRAIRLLRGHKNAHNSMLVNASRFTDVQRKLRNEIHQYLETLKSSAKVNGGLPPRRALKDRNINELHESWKLHYAHSSKEEWAAIQKTLVDSIAPIGAVEVNSNSSGSLNYLDHAKTGLNVIAVGGFSLSRGLTLEGLIVSYFLRNSMMYDTLMQMGRWFGYRPGYDDLCKVWMPEEAEGWYAHISNSIEELRADLREMQAANATPEQFGLRVRSHPDRLIVTARNKMGSGEKMTVSIGLANKFVETAILNRNGSALEENRNAVQTLCSTLTDAGHSLYSSEVVRNGRLTRNAPVNAVVEFVSSFRNAPGSMLTASEPIRRYIDGRSKGELEKWDILFTSLQKASPIGMKVELEGIAINCQRRLEGKRSDKRTLHITDKQRVSSRGVERTGLTDAEIAEAQAAYRDEKGISDPSSKPNYPDRIYREYRKRPLLIVHLLAIGEEGEDLSKERPVVAWSISFPKSATKERKVEYVVNTTWLRENYGDEIDEGEFDGDD